MPGQLFQVAGHATLHLSLFFLEFKVDLPLLQGTSVAGAQRGLEDSRSSLVKEPFRVYDELEKPFFTQRHWLYKRLTNFLMSCHHSS